ncbi:hypothetical protein [Streptomyces sp. TRM68367]|uniref:hypothetical protein n=1 Tax=Streptomyces sp. TRM68367 TaxID=2758415 RepID=UPI0037DCB123
MKAASSPSTAPAFLLVRQGSTVAVQAGMLMLGLRLICLLGTMSAAPSLIGVAAVAAMKETARKQLAGSPPAVQTREEAAELIEEPTTAPRF